MKTKEIGVWMDHSTAELIDLNASKTTTSIQSEFTSTVKEEVLSRSEKTMHNKEGQQHEAYYQKIAEALNTYDHVLLFGPTNAKVELHNYLKKDGHFKKIKLDVEAADYWTENQKIAFVKEHFGK